MTIIPSSSYSLNSSSKNITLSPPYDTLTTEQIILVYDLSKRLEIYNSKNPLNYSMWIAPSSRVYAFDIDVSSGVLSYVCNSLIEDTDTIQIMVDEDIIDGGSV